MDGTSLESPEVQRLEGDEGEHDEACTDADECPTSSPSQGCHRGVDDREALCEKSDSQAEKTEPRRRGDKSPEGEAPQLGEAPHADVRLPGPSPCESQQEDRPSGGVGTRTALLRHSLGHADQRARAFNFVADVSEDGPEHLPDDGFCVSALPAVLPEADLFRKPDQGRSCRKDDMALGHFPRDGEDLQPNVREYPIVRLRLRWPNEVPADGIRTSRSSCGVNPTGSADQPLRPAWSGSHLHTCVVHPGGRSGGNSSSEGRGQERDCRLTGDDDGSAAAALYGHPQDGGLRQCTPVTFVPEADRQREPGAENGCSPCEPSDVSSNGRASAARPLGGGTNCGAEEGPEPSAVGRLSPTANGADGEQQQAPISQATTKKRKSKATEAAVAALNNACAQKAAKKSRPVSATALVAHAVQESPHVYQAQVVAVPIDPTIRSEETILLAERAQLERIPTSIEEQTDQADLQRIRDVFGSRAQTLINTLLAFDAYFKWYFPLMENKVELFGSVADRELRAFNNMCLAIDMQEIFERVSIRKHGSFLPHGAVYKVTRDILRVGDVTAFGTTALELQNAETKRVAQTGGSRHLVLSYTGHKRAPVVKHEGPAALVQTKGYGTTQALSVAKNLLAAQKLRLNGDLPMRRTERLLTVGRTKPLSSGKKIEKLGVDYNPHDDTCIKAFVRLIVDM